MAWVLLVWSNCHCGCQRVGSDIKRDGWVSCFIICHFGQEPAPASVETRKKRYLEHDSFISHTTLLQYEKNPRLQHSPSHSFIISTHKAQFVTFYSLPWTITYLDYEQSLFSLGPSSKTPETYKGGRKRERLLAVYNIPDRLVFLNTVILLSLVLPNPFITSNYPCWKK